MVDLVKIEYEGKEIDFRDDGWFNATQAAAKFGKEPREWLKLPGTKSYLSAIERKWGKIPHYKTKRGKGGGTWMHPKAQA